MHSIIMAGGSGKRFWPLSRRRKPKQLLNLFSDETMLAQTVSRLTRQSPPENVVVVTGAHLLEEVKKCLPQVPAANIIAEPVGRNTAPCIGLATHVISRQNGGDPIIGVFPSDHHIENVEAFERAVGVAIDAASQPGVIVTLGIRPDRPETGYGYIRHDGGSDPAIKVLDFVEKPDLPTAETYLRSGQYLWNAGLFFFRASTMLAEIEGQLPDMASKLDTIAASLESDDFESVLRDVFPSIEGVSIDYGVMENAKVVKVVPVDAGWNDVGHWAALHEVMQADADGCIKRGDVIAIDTRDSVAFNDRPGHVLALVGVDDLVVVTTKDATVIMPRSRAQDVRKVVEALEARGDSKHL